MASASLRAFCTADEFANWIRKLAAKYELGCVIFRTSTRYGIVVDAPDEIQVHQDTYRMFLYPALQPPAQPLMMNDVRSRPWGWVDARPGRLSSFNGQTILTLSEVHGEDFPYEAVHPARFVRWLKRQVASLCRHGVLVASTTSDAAREARDICYTPGAEDMHNAGASWKQFPDGNVVYRPLPK